MTDIDGLHHVGHLVTDLGLASDRLTRLGFRVDPPAFPALSPAPGEPARAVGAGNAHVTFARNFVEIATVVGADGRVPANAELVPLQVPESARPALLAAIESTVHNLSERLSRFEGLHILMFDSPDLDVLAARLSDNEVAHEGVRTARRGTGDSAQIVRYLEIGEQTLGAGRVPEGRVGAAVGIQPEHTDDADIRAHPNGAVDLVGCVLAVAPDQLDETERRYARYLDRPGRAGEPGRVFDLGAATLTLLTPGELARQWPGESPPELPAMVGYQVAVLDLAETENFLRTRDVEPVRTGSGELLVSSTYAEGTAITFRQYRGNGHVRTADPQPE